MKEYIAKRRGILWFLLFFSFTVSPAGVVFYLMMDPTYMHTSYTSYTHTSIQQYSLSLFLSITCGFVDRHQSSSASSSFYPSGAFLSIFLFHFSPGKLKDRFYISVPSDGPNSSPGDRKTRTLQRERALALWVDSLARFRTPGDPGPAVLILLCAPSSKWSFFHLMMLTFLFLFYLSYFCYFFTFEESRLFSSYLTFHSSCPPAATKIITSEIPSDCGWNV